MKEEFHNSFNPDFKSQFSLEYDYPQLVYPGKFNPPNVDELIDRIGISSKLEYEEGIAVNLNYLSDHHRKKGSPLFTFEEKKVHDIIEALLDASYAKNDDYKKQIEAKYASSVSSSGDITKPILALMMWGPQDSDALPDCFNVCKLEFDSGNVELHKCLNFV